MKSHVFRWLIMVMLALVLIMAVAPAAAGLGGRCAAPDCATADSIAPITEAE